MHASVLVSSFSEMCSNPKLSEAEWTKVAGHTVFFPGILCTSPRDINKHLVIPDRVWMTDWRKDSTEVQLAEPVIDKQ